MTVPLVNPLRYPGSKAVMVDYLASAVVSNDLVGCHFYELFAGSASASLSLLSSGTVGKATLVERDPLLYSFWHCVFKRTRELVARVDRLEVTLANWKKMQRFLKVDHPSQANILDLAVAGLFLNRANYSGILHAKPIGGINQNSEYDISCRFNRDRIVDSILELSKTRARIRVLFGDAVSYLARVGRALERQQSLVYIDPPYVGQGRKLYRYHFDEVGHRRLADRVNQVRSPWIVSYDNHPLVTQSFIGRQVVPISLNYTVRKSRRADELMISNILLPQPHYVDSKGCSVDVDPREPSLPMLSSLS